MLAPDNRRLYSSIFTAPPGYVFDSAVGTTFSLDLEMLLFVPFCVAHGGSRDPEQGAQDPVALLEGIHRVAERVTVFFQDGETNAPNPPSPIYSLLENSLVRTRAPAHGLFHPKCWVIRFISETEPSPSIRVVVLSRNLTKSRSWDTMVCLNGSPNAKKPVKESAGLAALLSKLPSLAIEGTSDARLAQVQQLADEVRRTEFWSPLPFEGLAAFQTIGLGGSADFMRTEPGERALAVSPFVSSATLKELAAVAPAGKRQLISRIEEMAKCDPAALKDWSCFAMNEAANSDAEGGGSDEIDRTAEAAPQGLHAKALVVDCIGGRSKTSVWWLGSGNLTDAVRNGSNVELMVRLEGKTAKVGVEVFQNGFLPLLEEYQHRAPPVDPQEGARALVEKAKAALIGVDLKVACERGDTGWDLTVLGAAQVPDGVKVVCRPISVPEAHNQRWMPGGTSLTFRSLTVESLTGFIVFHLHAGSGDGAVELAFTSKLPVSGIPAERDKLIARSIIKDRSAFLRYLSCVLGSFRGLEEASGDMRAGVRGGASGFGSAFLGAGLLESLVRALHHDPARLRGIQKLIERASTEEDGDAAVVPEEFVEVWRAFQHHLVVEQEAG